MNGELYINGRLIDINQAVPFPFTYNISVGIGAGFVTHVVIRVVQGRGKELHPLLLLVSGLFMVYFLSSPINAWIG